MATSPRPVFRCFPVASTAALLASAACLLLLFFSACGDSGPSGPDPLDAIASVTVTPPQVTVDMGSTSQLNATVKDGHGATVSGSVTWSSSASGVATVNTSGLVTGVTEGSATITASASGKSGTSSITVNDPNPPAQPTDVTATPVSDTGIQVTWTDASGNEDEFRIDREVAPNPAAAEGANGQSQRAVVQVGTVGADVTSFDDTGLTAGTIYRYWVRACNQNGCSELQQSGHDVATYTVLVITTETVPLGWVGEAYSQTLTATGGGGEPQWSIMAGSAPDGITLSPTGTLSGMPTAAGTFDFTVQASGGGQDVTQALSLAVYSPVAISTPTLSNGAVGLAYQANLQATGGDGTYLWAQEGGVLPPGLMMGPDGSIDGTPTDAGTYNFQVVVHSSTRQATGTVSIQISQSLCPAQTDIPQAQCEALEALYNATDGPNWIDNTDWLATLTPCSWYGLLCSEGSVYSLSLKDNELVGEIPPELGDLPNLEYIRFSRNHLVGSIPPELGNLTALVVLDLYNNELSGPLPPELGNMINLHDLSLGNQAISGPIPPELGNLTELITFGLSGNQLTGTIPPELGNLTKVHEFQLNHNNLTGNIPASLGNLTEVERFRLDFNQLTGTIPPELGNLSKATAFYLRANALSGSIPPELGSMSALQEMYLGSNQVTGAIPSELGNLTSLRHLHLYSNQLTGAIPAELGNLTVLESIILDSNQLDSLVPLSMAQLGGSIQNTFGGGRCAFLPGNAGLSLLDNPDYRAADLDADGFICGVPFPPGPFLVFQPSVLHPPSLELNREQR